MGAQMRDSFSLGSDQHQYLPIPGIPNEAVPPQKKDRDIPPVEEGLSGLRIGRLTPRLTVSRLHLLGDIPIAVIDFVDLLEGLDGLLFITLLLEDDT